jgi:general secretion pathway protein I
MRSRRVRGFSLLEMLAALSLFAIVASAVVTLASQSMRRTIENRHGTQAALLIQTELERLRELDYPNVVAGTTMTSMAGQSYSMVTAVAADTPAANMKQVTVTVSWTGPEGARSYAVQTILTDVTAS